MENASRPCVEFCGNLKFRAAAGLCLSEILSRYIFVAAADNPSAARKPIKKFKCDDKTCYLKNLSAQTLAKF